MQDKEIHVAVGLQHDQLFLISFNSYKWLHYTGVVRCEITYSLIISTSITLEPFNVVSHFIMGSSPSPVEFFP